MKKLISIAIVLLMVILTIAPIANAATKSSLADEIYSMGKPYGLTQNDFVRIERFINSYVENDEQADAIYAQAVEADNYMKEQGITNIEEIKNATPEQKSKLVSIANKAADEIGVQLTFKNGAVEISKDGKLIEVISFKDGKLVYTGNNVNSVLIISALAIVALATIFVVRRKVANA